MRETSGWAFWRRLQYGVGFSVFWLLVGGLLYQQYIYEPPTCFDGMQNGEERGVDCGGGCLRICTADVIAPSVKWAQSFKIRDGQYNIVGYVENRNQDIASPDVPYKVSIYDTDGLITEKTGSTPLPPDSVYPIFVGPLQLGDRVPTNTFLELGTATEWYPSDMGRNQFTVSGRNLTGEDTRPRLEAQIINNSLVEAKSVEVVATMFDVRGNALNSSRTFVTNFAPRSQETIVFTWPEPIAKTLRSCEVPIDLALAIDLSGSMNNDQALPPEPISSVLRSAEAFVNRLRARDQVAVVTFATEALLAKQLSSDRLAVAETIQNLAIDPAEETGSTNTGDAFLRAAEELSSVRHAEESRKIMVILTDGLATAPDNEPAEYALEQAAKLKSSEVEVYAIALGNEADMDFVRQLASSPTSAFQALSVDRVDEIYRTITSSICEDGPAVIDIIPKVKLDIADS